MPVYRTRPRTLGDLLPHERVEWERQAELSKAEREKQKDWHFKSIETVSPTLDIEPFVESMKPAYHQLRVQRDERRLIRDWLRRVPVTAPRKHTRPSRRSRRRTYK